MRRAGLILSGLLAVYFALNLSACALQEKLLFQPPKAAQTPTSPLFSEHTIETSDGEKLVAWYSAAKPSCPTLIHFHGNGTAIGIDRWRYQRILDRGVGLLVLAWRGYSGSTGEPGEAGLHLDARATFEFVRAQGVATDQIILHGHSMGTGPALKLASEEKVGAVVLEAPYYSLEDLVSRKAPLLPVSLMLRHKMRSDQWIGTVEAPILIAHGTRDSVIPFSQGERLFAIAPEPKTFARFEGSEHNTLVRDGLFELHEWTFLARHFPQPADFDAASGCKLWDPIPSGDDT